MSSNPLSIEQDKEEEAKKGMEEVKDEDWEVVDKSKETSMTAVSMNSLDFDKIKDISEKSHDQKTDDFYKTIPATPANTPEYRPSPPAYPSASLRKPEVQKLSEPSDLPPIKEDVAEDISQDPHQDDEENIPKGNVTPENSELEAPFSLKRSLVIVGFGLFRLLIFVLVFGIVKWTLSKVYHKIKGLRSEK